MYLSTHRIESLEPPKHRAIHGFLYVHGKALDLSARTFEEITVRDPGGELVGSRTPKPPSRGGNAVLSFLDIVAPDDVGTDELKERLEKFPLDIAGSELPAKSFEEPAWLQFHITTPDYRREKNAVDEYEELKEQALSMFEEWRSFSE